MLQLSACYHRPAHPMASFDDLAVAHINESAMKLGIEMSHLDFVFLEGHTRKVELPDVDGAWKSVCLPRSAW